MDPSTNKRGRSLEAIEDGIADEPPVKKQKVKAKGKVELSTDNKARNPKAEEKADEKEKTPEIALDVK